MTKELPDTFNRAAEKWHINLKYLQTFLDLRQYPAQTILLSVQIFNTIPVCITLKNQLEQVC